MADSTRNDGTISEELGGLGQRVAGNVQNAYGAVTGDRSVEARGEMNAAQGANRQANNQMVTGLFRDRESADRAYSSLRSRGYTDNDINLMMSDQTRDSWFSGSDAADSALGNKALEGAGTGSAIGGTLGAIIAGIAAIGTNVLLPGLGLVVAGPLAAALAGAGAGGLTGGLLGALVGSGIPEEHAARYEEGIRSGGMVMGFNPRSEEDRTYFNNEFGTYR